MEEKRSENKRASAVKTVGLMMIITLAGKLLGLLRDRLLTVNYGTGMEANAFLTASRIPRVFFDTVFASAISASFIPIFSDVFKKRGKDDAMAFSAEFLSVMTVLCAALTALGAAFAEPLTRLFADGYDATTMALCVSLTRIMFPTVIFTGVAFSFVGILQSMDEFNIPAAISLVSNGLIILYYLTLNERFGIQGLAVTFLIAWLLQAVIQIPSLRKKGFRFRFRLRVHSEDLGAVFRLMAPVMVSTWVIPINQTINSKFGSRLFDGAGVSAIELSYNLYTVIAGVFVLSVTNYIFPKLSRQKAEDDAGAFRDTLRSSMHTTLFFVLPMTAGLMLLSQPLVRFIYGGGAFDAFSVEITSRALFWISLGMTGYAAQAVLCRAFFAEKNGMAPLLAGAVSIGVNLLLCRLLIGRLDVTGLAVASAAASTVNAAILALLLRLRGGGFADRRFWADAGKMLLSSALMALAVLAVRRLTETRAGDLAVMAVSAAAGCAVYFAAAALLRLDESLLVFRKLGRLKKSEDKQ